MFSNFLRVAYRNLRQHKLYSFINIGGLSIGIGACMLILLFVLHEHSYDKFHKNATEIYSIYSRIKIGGDTVQFPGMSYGTAAALQKSDPSVVATLRTQNIFGSKKTIHNPESPDKKFGEKHFIFADSFFFRFFSFRLLRGDPDRVLTRPYTVVITQAAAKKYFGNADPIGKLLKYDSAYTFEVTGIADNAPSNSSIAYDFVASMSSQPLMSQTDGDTKGAEILYGNYATYVQVKKGTKPQYIEKTLSRLSKLNKIYADVPARYCMNPLVNTHLGLNFSDDGSSRYLSIFPLVAGLILLLALINYMNLSTARATLRAKEVGVRKAIGASRGRIAQQFYVESALYAGIAFALGFLWFRLAQPYFYQLIQLHIDPSFIYQPVVLLVFAGLLLITILIAGTYPSIVLSAYNPVVVLYGRFSKQKGGAGLRKILTVLQFTASIVLIISSILIEKQLWFFRHTDTGVNRENVVGIPIAGTMGRHVLAFGAEVQRLPGIAGTSLAKYALYEGYTMYQVKDRNSGKDVSLNSLNVDEHFIPLLDIRWKMKPATDDYIRQDHQVVLNEAAVEKLQLPVNPIGQQISINTEKFNVAGVVKNFNYNSLHAKIEGLSLFVTDVNRAGQWIGQSGNLMVRIGRGTNIPATIETIKKIYDRYDINTPFEFQFMDEAFNARYKAEDKLAGILDVFTGLTVLIACLGLFGLAAFSATQKTKEIGIRKVLGASVRNIVFLLTKDFIRLVALAILLATPLSWYLMHGWLKNFAYKTPMSWSIFAIAGFSAILIAILTVSFEAIRSAIANPVKSLKAE